MSNFIKALTWNEHAGDWRAQTPFGEYWVVNTFNGWACWTPRSGDRKGRLPPLGERKYATADCAMNRCREDYEIRIRELLVEPLLYTIRPLQWFESNTPDSLEVFVFYGMYKVYPLNSEEWIGTFLGKCHEIPDSTVRVPLRAAALSFCQDHYKETAEKYLDSIVPLGHNGIWEWSSEKERWIPKCKETKRE